MDIERNLLFGILARHAGLIDGATLSEVIRQWSANRTRSLADLLDKRVRIEPAQREQISGLLESAVSEHGGNAAGALSAILDGPKRFLAADEDARIRRAISAAFGPALQKTMIQAPTHFAEAGVTVESETRHDESHYEFKEALPSGPRYTRTSLHASGGMGKVWLAHDANIGRDVALKELRAESSANASIPLRFLREARITGQLEHPGVVPVYEIGHDSETGRPYYTMRFVRGGTLEEASRTFHEHRKAGQDDPLEFVNLLSAFVSVCHTIAYAHSHGIVHRDLKGENIVLGDFGEVIVLDWGLAKHFDGQDVDDFRLEAPGHDSILPTAGQTMMGQVMGTPAYMAPEQALGRMDLIGPRTDIFGIGAILYEILAGRPPFAGNSTVDVLGQAKRGDILPPRVHWPEAPAALEAACLKALAKDPDDRYASASELAREVQSWQDRQRRRAENELRQAGARLMQQQEALVKLTRSEVFSATDLIQTYRQMIEVSARTLDVERVSVWRYTDDRKAIRCELLYELSSGETSSGIELRANAFPGYFDALKKSEVIAAHDARHDPQTREFTNSYLVPLDIGAIMDAPIHVSGELAGVVCHEHVGRQRQWMPDEQLFAIAIANLVSQAISLWAHRT